ncbi:MAG: hypothetical protein JXK94_14135 [Deltaproteobacteria bacterium]|nr:hypothetical protein [Deltaproteobacteria bacterium]
MLILPRGKAVKEKIGLKNFDLLDCLKKLQTGHFTGYLRFDCPEGTGVILFNRGKMIGIFFQKEKENLIALRALTSIFQNIHTGRSLLHIYSVTTRLLMNLFEILHGNIIYQGQELLLLDVPFLLQHIKKEHISGALRVYVGTQVAIIFYRQGAPVGYFHDGGKDIETSADPGKSLALKDGACLDLMVSRDSEGMVLVDFNQSIDLPALWQKTMAA